MAFVVEDGTGKVDANSYGSVAGADAYFADRGVTTWVGSDTVKQQALVKATDYIDTRFSTKFKGYVLYPDVPQALAFPRTAFDGMPVVLLKATYEYALRSLAKPLAPDPATSSVGGAITSQKKKVGPLETETHYAEGTSSVTVFQPYPMADALIAKLLNLSNRVIR